MPWKERNEATEETEAATLELSAPSIHNREAMGFMLIHPNTQQLIDFRLRVLRPDVFLEVYNHLRSCPSCAESYGGEPVSMQDYVNLLDALLPQQDEAPFHLADEELLGYIRGLADATDVEIVETHLSTCDDCQAALSNLAAGKSEGLKTRHVAAARATPLYVIPASFYLAQTFGRHRLKVAASLIAIVSLAGVLLFTQVKDGDEKLHSVRPFDSGSGVSAPAPFKVEVASHLMGPKAEPGGASIASSARKVAVRRDAPESLLAPRIKLNDGGRIVRLKADGELTGLGSFPPGMRRTIRVALVSGRIKLPQGLTGLQGNRDVLLGELEALPSFRLLSPVGIVVVSRQPVFRWSPLPGASSYTVTVTDGEYNEISTSGPVARRDWKVSKELEPGKTYLWQVMALKDGKELISPALPAPSAKFKIVDQAHLNLLRRGERSNSHLIRGLIYAKAGLLDEAAREFRALSEENPGAEIPQKLLRSVQQ